MAESGNTSPEAVTQNGMEENKKTNSEISAATVARMMGLSTASDLKLLDGKIELLISRVASMTAKLDKATQVLQKVSTTTDIDRVDLQVSNLKTIVKKLFMAISEKGDVIQDKESAEAAIESLDE